MDAFANSLRHTPIPLWYSDVKPATFTTSRNIGLRQKCKCPILAAPSCLADLAHHHTRSDLML